MGMGGPCLGWGAPCGDEWGSLTPPIPAVSPPAGDSLVAPGHPYWPGEFVTTASESEGPAGGSETLRVEPAGGQGPPRGDLPRPNGELLPRAPPLLPLPHPHKGTGCYGSWGGHLKAETPPNPWVTPPSPHRHPEEEVPGAHQRAGQHPAPRAPPATPPRRHGLLGQRGQPGGSQRRPAPPPEPAGAAERHHPRCHEHPRRHRGRGLLRLRVSAGGWGGWWAPIGCLLGDN